MIRHWRAVALVVTLMALALGVHGAAASKLTMSGPIRPRTTSLARCSGNTVAVAVTGTAVTVTNIDGSACAGLSLRLDVRADGATQTVSGTVSGASLALTLPTAVTTFSSGLVTIDTWGVPSTWTVKPVAVPFLSCESITDSSLPCTATVERLTAPWPSGGGQVLELMIRVSTTSTKKLRWAVTINFSSSELPYLAKGAQDIQNGLVVVDPVVCTASPRTLKVRQVTNWDTAWVSSSQTATIDMFVYSTATGNLFTCP